MASAEFSEKSENQRPQVQVGDPFIEKITFRILLRINE